MTCTNCAATLEEGARTCAACGRTVDAAGAPETPAAADRMAGRWRPDPAGIHQLRFFDDEIGKWTDWVADDGTTGRDPIPMTAVEHLAADAANGRTTPATAARSTAATRPTPAANPSTPAKASSNWRFSPLSDPGMCVLILMALLAAASLIAIFADVQAADSVGAEADVRAEATDPASGAETFFEAMKGVQAFTLLIGLAFFIWWLRRATGNLAALGATDAAFGTGWAIGGWFVPILNWWRPYQLAAQAWRGSGAAAGGNVSGWRQRPANPEVIVWWVLFFAAGAFGFFPFNLWSGTNDLADMEVAAWLSIPADLLLIAAAAVTFRFVRTITKWQADAHARLQGGGGR